MFFLSKVIILTRNSSCPDSLESAADGLVLMWVGNLPIETKNQVAALNIAEAVVVGYHNFRIYQNGLTKK